ncbi:hypothetical protein GOBAR_DD18625 [Gossypium barbadense]|nr:hypothetical protein GOBAR_DD18625 [Gossypium barbadense]
MDVLLEFENRQQHMEVETPYHANLVESTPPLALMMVDSSRFVRFNRNYDGPVLAMIRLHIDQSFDVTHGSGSS